MTVATQNTKLLKHLRDGGTVTVWSGINDLRISSIPRRILDLKEAGANIVDVWEKKNGRRFKRWSLIKEKPNG